VQHVARPKVHPVTPGKKTKQAIEQLIQPSGFERCAVAQLMHGCLRSRKSVEHEMDGTHGEHRDPQPPGKEITGEKDGEGID